MALYVTQQQQRTNVTWCQKWERYQQAGESFDTYLADLRQLVKTCNYGPMEDEQMRDRIICGVRNEQRRTTLFNKKKLDLAAAINICRTARLHNYAPCRKPTKCSPCTRTIQNAAGRSLVAAAMTIAVDPTAKAVDADVVVSSTPSIRPAQRSVRSAHIVVS